MHSFFMRFLVLLCSMLLVPPPGWCCLLSRVVPASKSAESYCGCPFCHDDHGPAQHQPAPQKPTKCPCFDRTSMLPAAAKTLPISAPLMVTGLIGDLGHDGAAISSRPPIAESHIPSRLN